MAISRPGPGAGRGDRRQGDDADRRPAARRGRASSRAVSRPFLDYSLSALADAGYTDVCLVVAPDHEAMARHYAGAGQAAPPAPRLRRPGRRRSARPTPSPRRRRGPATTRSSSSTATTTMLCARWRRSSGAPARPRRSIRAETLLARSNIPADRIRAFALGVVEDGRLARIVEKPTPEQAAALGDALVSMTCWRMPPAIHDGLPAGDALGARRARAGRRGQRAHRRRRPLRGRRRRRRRARSVPARRRRGRRSRRWRA